MGIVQEELSALESASAFTVVALFVGLWIYSGSLPGAILLTIVLSLLLAPVLAIVPILVVAMSSLFQPTPKKKTVSNPPPP
jgi:uncharacterized protein YqhQ